MNEGPYEHPNIRDEQVEAFKTRLDIRRDQRLTLAIVAQGERVKKLQIHHGKNREKHEKLGDQNATYLAKVDELIDKITANINKMQVISHEQSLIEQEQG